MSNIHLPERYEDIEDLNRAVEAVRENIRDLIEQGTAHSGAGDDELLSKRICRARGAVRVASERAPKDSRGAPIDVERYDDFFDKSAVKPLVDELIYSRSGPILDRSTNTIVGRFVLPPDVPYANFAIDPANKRAFADSRPK